MCTDGVLSSPGASLPATAARPRGQAAGHATKTMAPNTRPTRRGCKAHAICTIQAGREGSSVAAVRTLRRQWGHARATRRALGLVSEIAASAAWSRSARIPIRLLVEIAGTITASGQVPVAPSRTGPLGQNACSQHEQPFRKLSAAGDSLCAGTRHRMRAPTTIGAAAPYWPGVNPR